MCANFTREMIIQSKITKSCHETIKSGIKCGIFDKKNMYIFILKQQVTFFVANKSININFLLQTLRDPFY